MTELHTLLARELDPIDDVRRQFESFYTQSYFHPSSGDWISDDYYRLIDLTTKPGKLSDDESGKLYRSITRLNEKYTTIQIWLGGSSLLGAYNDVAEQISTINSADPNRTDIPLMKFAPVEEPAVR